jgi:hypothetical protein
VEPWRSALTMRRLGVHARPSARSLSTLSSRKQSVSWGHANGAALLTQARNALRGAADRQRKCLGAFTLVDEMIRRRGLLVG